MTQLLTFFCACCIMLAASVPRSYSAESSETLAMPELAYATFGGGCFWCLQPAFDATAGVSATSVGYTGGTTENPTYYEISSGKTGHVEVIQVTYNPQQVTYEQLLEVFWRQIDPTQVNGQFADRGSQYRTVIFTHDEAQAAAATASKEALQASNHFGKPIVTAIEPAAVFYPAEEEHQKYYLKAPAHYQGYKRGSGRAAFIEQHWGKK